MTTQTTTTLPTDDEFGRSSNAAIQNARDIRKQMKHWEDRLVEAEKELKDFQAECAAGAKFVRVHDVRISDRELDKSYAVLINGDLMGYVFGRKSYVSNGTGVFSPIWSAYTASKIEGTKIGHYLGRVKSRREAAALVLKFTL